jgi:hypothetical protein
MKNRWIFQPDSDISDYTYERTLVMEERYKLLRDMRLNDRDLQFDIQTAVADAAHERKLSRIQEEDQSGQSQSAEKQVSNSSSGATETHQLSPSRPIEPISEEGESAATIDNHAHVRFIETAHVRRLTLFSPDHSSHCYHLDHRRQSERLRIACGKIADEKRTD